MTIHGVGQNYAMYAKPFSPRQKPMVQSDAQTNANPALMAKSPISAKQQPTEQQTAAGEKPNNLESFTYGALGMDHPEDVKKNNDEYYTAGQFLSAAATVGGILLMVV
ncbi:hypothetical protein VST7929_02598 [Vibrio stylophorae]|uniref:Uncharacterized protein n=1 Tax=Vibrio stylophorae TaxID=659351 RepID=A0ABM8ZWD3_9VIBR|nr:hypothetical protein [Vibrio stylophorae]CAH0534648.1 hypothetical protein VST7929_02598 [Vibrio stylophorae]